MQHTPAPFYADSLATLYHADVLEGLRSLPDASVHCVVTSPPYWNLRDYGTGTWEGGNPDCDHVDPRANKVFGSPAFNENRPSRELTKTAPRSNICHKCGATRIDQQLGMEPLHDCAGWATGEPCGQCFICRMVAVFSEVKRVLRDDGTLWLNIGDSYAGSGGAGGDYAPGGLKDGQPKFSGTARTFRPGAGRADGIVDERGQRNRNGVGSVSGLKPKDLCMIPARLALALQAQGWYVRSHIVWAKKSPMPESVTDRPSSAWEPIWLLTKSAKYFYDAEAVREANISAPSSPQHFRNSSRYVNQGQGVSNDHHSGDIGEAGGYNPAGRNQRNVWLLGPEPYPAAHFATFPTEIPRRAILAGTSERGCCPHCGAPWRRLREPSAAYAAHLGKGYHDHGNDAEAGMMQAKREGFKSVNAEYVTTGWAQGCTCPAADPIPCVVLEPFAGSGTTLMVARQLVRRSIGIDLNAEYLQLAVQRIQSVEPGIQLNLLDLMATSSPPVWDTPTSDAVGTPSAN